MKVYTFILLFIFTNSLAQKRNLTPESFAGNYSQGSSAAIYVDKDSTFVLVGYATFVPGKYSINKNTIHFQPTIAEQTFTVLGRFNKSIKTGIKITMNADFKDDGPTYINYDEKNYSPIFEGDSQYSQSSHVLFLKTKPKSITLGEDSFRDLHRFNTNTFLLDEKFNDYIFHYRHTISEQSAFNATISTRKGKEILDTRWGEFVKSKTSTSDDMTEYIDKYKKAPNDTESKFFYYNDQLKSANGFNQLSEETSIFNINNYILDENANKYIRKDIYDKNIDYTDAKVEDYHDESIILRYDALKVSNQKRIDYSKIKLLKPGLINVANEDAKSN